MTEETHTPGVPLAVLILEMLDELDLTRRQFAFRAGLHPGLVDLCLARRCDFPLDKIPEIARAIGFQREALMTIALREAMPKMIEALINSYVDLTDNEFQLIDFIRIISGKANPSPTDENVRRGLTEIFGVEQQKSE